MIPPDVDYDMWELYRIGKLDTEIAEALGVSKDDVCRWRWKYGYPTNRKKKAQKESEP